ncbi:hypothetical protein E4U39_007585 [Claviceps sp. Clav50 group G5]|nr:hypothetical protein E4U39_007585 [Claviceps sp. Clav50 group G5]
MTNFPGQGFAGGKIAVRNEPRHPPATPLNLSITQSTITYPPTAPASPSAASAGGNRISTAVAITIGLATVSSLALILAILLYCKVYRRRQRSGCLEAALHSQGNPTNGSRKSPLAIPASSVSILLADLTPSCSNPTRSSALPAPSTHPSRSAGCVRDPATCAPARLARPPVSSELGLSDGQGGASSWWKNYGDRARRVTSMETVKDCNSSPNNQLSTPPPRLMDRNLHPSISSGPNMSISSPISTPVLKEPGPTFRRQGGHVRGRHTPIIASDVGANWQVPISFITSAHPPLRTVISGDKTSPTSATQSTTHDSGVTSPPRTPAKTSMLGPIRSLETPGPPPCGPLPSPPPKTRHINSSSSPAKSPVHTSCPKEIGVAVSGPSNSAIITIDKPYYQVWCDASRWQPPTSIREEEVFF